MPSDRLIDIAAAVADGTAVDWDSAGRSVSSDDDRRLLRGLRFIAELPQQTAPTLQDSSGLIPASPGSGERAGTSEADPLPRSWGPLNILEHVGRGTFGDVYRAWDTRLDREVALKILRHHQPAGDAAASTVVDEGRLLARVRHPNVVTVFGADHVHGEVGIWMEFIRGQTLEQELQQRGPLQVNEVLEVGVQIAGALAAVHRAGLLHRDIKTHNVIRDGDGRLILTDLGAGCELEERVDVASPDLAGTPLYVAPEVLSHQPATARSDVYSLGVLLFHLATGAYPVRGHTMREIRQAHAGGSRSPLRDARSDLPNDFSSIVDRAVDPDPERRYATAEMLAADLTRALERRQLGASTPPVLGWLRSKVPLAAMVLLAGFAVGALLSLPRAGTPPVIAVLPFENLSADASTNYFVDGLTDEIIGKLSVVDGLTVRSRASSFMFKGKPRNLREVGAKLQAGLVLEGSVLRADQNLRISARLVRIADDATLWSNSFEREVKDVFDMQDGIARAIVRELRLSLPRDQRRVTNIQTYELHLKAIALLHPHEVRGAREAAALFEKVVDGDPAFAPAHAGLADAVNLLSMNYAGVSSREGYPRMREAAEKALALDGGLAEAHAAIGLVLARDRDWAGSEAAFRRAIALNPNHTWIRANFAIWCLFAQSKADDALVELERALSNDPLSIDLRKLMAWVQVSAGRYDHAIANSRVVLAEEPQHIHTKQQLARALYFNGQPSEAIQILETLGPSATGALGYLYAVTRRQAEAERLAEQSAKFPSRLVLIRAGLGDKDGTFEALDAMAEANEPRTGQYLSFPELAFIRGDERLVALRRKLSLQP